MTDVSRILITGANGLIGQKMSFGIKASRDELDVTNPEAIGKFCEKFNPSGIVCLSSIDLRSCEKDPLSAYKVNVLGVYNLALEAVKRDIPIIILSTGAIFNGLAGKSFREGDIPNPQNIYGQTKYLAEIVVKHVAKKYIIARTGWVFGTTSAKKSGAIDRIIALAKSGERIKAVTDQTGSPTYVNDFLEALEKLIKLDSYGTFHITNDGVASAADVAKEIVSICKSSSEIVETKAEGIESNGPRRSPSEALASGKIKLRSWREALKSYLTAGN